MNKKIKTEHLKNQTVNIEVLKKYGEAFNQNNIFAVGDCGVISNYYRPASGVWAVREAKPLGENIERCSQLIV